MSHGGVEKITEYIERLAQIYYHDGGRLTKRNAMYMLAVLKCLESALTAYLIKMKL